MDDEVFNTLPDKTDGEVIRIASVAKAQLWQAVGELTRRQVVPGSNPRDIEQAVEDTIGEVLAVSFFSGQFDSEHEVLQNIIDNGGRFIPPATNDTEATASEEVTA